MLHRLRALFRTYKERDLDGLIELLAPDAESVVLGLGPDVGHSWWDDDASGREVTRALLELGWSGSESASIELNWHKVSVVGQVAWVSARVTVRRRPGRSQGWPGRLTAVLEFRNQQWLFQQVHVSLPKIGRGSTLRP